MRVGESVRLGEPGPGPATPPAAAEPDHRAGREDPESAPHTGGWLVQLVARVLVVAAAGVMAAGFLHWRAGVLVAALVALSYVLLATVAPRMPALWGPDRSLYALRRHGYHVIPVGTSRYLAVGPGGVYLLETRVWRHPVSWTGDEWWIGDLPAGRVFDRLLQHAAKLERALRLPDLDAELSVVPVVMVTSRLPKPVMRADTAVIARPRAAVRHIAEQPEALDADGIATVVEEAGERLRGL